MTSIQSLPLSGRKRTRQVKPGTWVDSLQTIDPAIWTQGYDFNSLAFDEMAVVDGWVTVPNPNQGPNNSLKDGAAHGCAYRDFGPDFADNFEIEIFWSAFRPCEATPLLHVDTTTNGFGAGFWPFFSLYPYAPPSAPTSIWGAGQIGRNNTFFSAEAPPASRALTDGQLAAYSPANPYLIDAYTANPPQPVSYKVRSSNNILTLAVNGEWTSCRFPVPAELIGNTIHGFAIDNNQTDGVGGAGAPGGGWRRPSVPSMCGPFTIRKI
jgi:hypothetical protein